MSNVRLEFAWAVKAETYVHVTTNHPLDSRWDTLLCPECRGPVCAKRGVERAWHFAHLQESKGCAIASGVNESILHLNTKAYIARVLANAPLGERYLKFRVKCRRFRCPAWHPFTAGDWTDVWVERSFEGLRPDILLLTHGFPKLAIEICVTHAVDEIKRQKLSEHNIPWYEIDATASIYSGERAWRMSHQLPPGRFCADDWECPDHGPGFHHTLSSIRSLSRQI